MILKECVFSSGGNEVTLKGVCGERFTITLADAKKEALSEPDDFPLEYSDDEYLEFLHQKLRAIKYCKYLLSFSDKSEKMLYKKLCEKEYSNEVASEALKILRESGYSDENEMCKRKALSLAKTKLYGPYRIRAFLSSKGYKKQDIDSALLSLEDDIDFYELCSRLAQKLLDNAGAENAYDDIACKIKAKLSKFGYSFEMIRFAFEDYFAG